MPDPSVVRKKLHSIADELVATGTSRRTSVRNLLSWFDFQRRGEWVVYTVRQALKSSDYRLGTRPMRFADKERRDTLIVNDRVQLAGIPPEAHRYVVNGRTPLEWLNYYYKTATDKRSGIVNDANEWFSDPRDLVTTIQRLVYLSIETARIVDGLPNPLPEEMTEFTFELEDV